MSFVKMVLLDLIADQGHGFAARALCEPDAAQVSAAYGTDTAFAAKPQPRQHEAGNNLIASGQQARSQIRA